MPVVIGEVITEVEEDVAVGSEAWKTRTMAVTVAEDGEVVAAVAEAVDGEDYYGGGGGERPGWLR